MKTNDAMRTALVGEAEAAAQRLLTTLQSVTGGDFKGLEEQVLTAVFELGRTWVESLLRGQTAGERPPASRVGSCGHIQRLVGERPKQVLTLMGSVVMTRPYYACRHEEQFSEAEETTQQETGSCSHGEAPADHLWGVHERRTSAGVQQLVSYLCASLTLEEAAQTFSRLFPLQMSARQALNLMQPVGQTLASQEQEQATALWAQAAQARTKAPDQPSRPPEAIERLYVELDGVLARMRRGSVPMEADEQQRTGDVYREIKVGAVFQASRGRERSDLAPGTWVDEPLEGSMRYVAQRTALGTFGRLLYTLAVQAGLSRAKQVVVLGDGGIWIWRLVEEHFPGAVQIVDLWHAQQHVWEVAHAVYGRSTPEGVAWAKQSCTLLVQGQIEALVRGVAALPPIAPPPGQTKSIPEQAIGYFTSNAERMRYPRFRAQGMQVGSGIAEAACKTVVSTRAKRAGMRWTPEGLDALLPLRTAVLNNSYDAFWQGRSHVLS